MADQCEKTSQIKSARYSVGDADPSLNRLLEGWDDSENEQSGSENKWDFSVYRQGGRYLVQVGVICEINDFVDCH